MSDGEKREKIFICVDVDIPRNDRIQALEEPAAGLGLWTALTCYAREQLTAPLVPKRYALSLWGEPRNAKRLADLVRVGLLAETETHYEVLRYAPRNQTKEMVEKSRESARVRAAKSREKRRDGNANGADESRVTHANGSVSETNGCANASFYSSSSDDPAGHERDPGGVQGGGRGSGVRAVAASVETDRHAQPAAPSGPLPQHVVNCERQYWIAAYETAVTTAKGGDRWSFPTKAFAALVSVINTHCQGENRRNIPTWIETDVAEFVRAVKARGEDPAKFWSSYGPDGLQRWHNQDRPGRAPARPPPRDEPRPTVRRASRESTLAALADVAALLEGSGVH